MPAEPRDSSRLMVVDRNSGKIVHDRFANLLKYLSHDDLVVFNQTKVIPARIITKKPTGGKLEIFLLKQVDNYVWECLSKPGITGKFALGEVIDKKDEILTIKFSLDRDELMRLGEIPLPPYIKRSETSVQRLGNKYQTVYAKTEGSVAAPTAGFHFTPELMDKIPHKAFVTLHVGLGTFQPVKVEDVEEHKMHTEWYDIGGAEVQRGKGAKKIVAVGTTSVRTLESWANSGKTSGETDIFIYPGYKFKVVDAMITNFHLPKSTLLMLVSAFAGTELMRKAYAEAIAKKYRFFSFGDAMLIL